MRALATLVLVLTTACAGGRGWISAPTATYPISLTHAIRAKDGHILLPNEREIVGAFDTEKTLVSMLYYALPLNPSFNISDDVNQQVNAAHGDAITDVTLTTTLCALDWFLVFHFLPFWPGCATVHVHGSIIRAHQVPSSTLTH